jgi:hypothetical protein
MIAPEPTGWTPEDLALIAAGVVFVATVAWRLDTIRDGEAALDAMRESAGLCEDDNAPADVPSTGADKVSDPGPNGATRKLRSNPR